jgi:uncharacterized membrane protein YGL010W
MNALERQLSKYAAYHRDRRNIATHFIGIPMIVVAVATLLSRPLLLEVGGLPITPAVLVTLGSVAFYLALDLRLGLVMAVLMSASVWAGGWFAAQSTGFWLTAGIGLFVLGWAIQFLGHFYEGKKPAFVDDLLGLLVGPLFVVAEAGFALGLRKPLEETIEAKAGPTYVRGNIPAEGRTTVTS